MQSPETYTGGERTRNFASADGAAPNEPRAYALPAQLVLNHWALSGNWTVGNGSIVLNEANGRIVYRFHARDLHLVLGQTVRVHGVRFRVTIDGRPPGSAHCADVNDSASGNLTDSRLYQLIRQPTPIADRLFGIEFLDPGAKAFAFTFG